MTTTSTQFIVRQTNINDTKFVDQDLPDLADGQILMKVDSFAFTANNITYAVIGKQFGYWQFFPSKEEGMGIIPVWGFADVAASAHGEIEKGERIYGYWPMATHVILEPGNVKDNRFVDAAAHRRELPAIYNDYTRVRADPYYDADLEQMRSLWFPLAGTSFGLFDWLQQTDYQDAETVLLVSASSKTAIGLAYLLDKHREGKRKIAGLTSASNKKAVETIGYYDSVIPYDDIEALDPSSPTVIIDFSGNGTTLARAHRHLGDNMKYTSIVGASHWDEERKGEGYNEERSRLFFMPAYAAQRLEETQGNFGHALGAASKEMAEAAASWMKTLQAAAKPDIDALYKQVKDGKLQPDEGGIMSFADL